MFYVDDITTMFDRSNYFSQPPTSALAAFNPVKTHNRFVDLDSCYGQIAILDDQQFEEFKDYYRKDLQIRSMDPDFNVVYIVAIQFKLEDDKNLVCLFLPETSFYYTLVDFCDRKFVKSQFVSNEFLSSGVYEDSQNQELIDTFLEVMNYS